MPPRQPRTASASQKTHKWQFTSRIRPNVFSWRSSATAVSRVRDAVTEIANVARKDPVIAAEGAVRLIERLSPALEEVDSSSGALGGAVNRAIEALVPLIAGAPVTIPEREAWLERLFEAHAADQIPYIERLADFWGELCTTTELARAWADRLLWVTRSALGPDKNLRGHFHGTTACLSSLLHAGRYDEIHAVLAHTEFWHYKCYAVRALAAEGKADEAIALAEASRGPWTSDVSVDRLCERILLDAGRAEEAYRRYGITAHRATTYLATFRELARTYPDLPRQQILKDLIEHSPGEEGKWFATAKDLGLYAMALELVRDSPCDPKTLARAARDFADREPTFAMEAGLAALRWLVRGHGYEITSLDVRSAYHDALKAAEHCGELERARASIRRLVATDSPGGFVRTVLGRELGLS